MSQTMTRPSRPDLDRIAQFLQLPVTLTEAELVRAWCIRCPDEELPMTDDVQAPADDGVVTSGARRLVGFSAMPNGQVHSMYSRTTRVRCKDGMYRIFEVVEHGDVVDDVPSVVANLFSLVFNDLRARALKRVKC